MRKQSIVVVFWAIITIVPIVGILVSLVDPLKFTSFQQVVQQTVEKDFVDAALLFVFIQALQVIITPISHYALGYLGGVSFGLVWGALFNYLGRVIGHLAAFWLARRFGRDLVERYVPAVDIGRYDRWIGGTPYALTLIYFLPFFPDDEISYLVGLSAMPMRWFMSALLIGQVGGSLGLACLGAGVKTHPVTFWGVLIATVLGAAWLWRMSRKGEKLNGQNPV